LCAFFYVAACRFEIPPPLQVESQPAMAVPTDMGVSELKKHPLETPIPVHVAACRFETQPTIQVESQPAMTVMMQEMVSELQKHPLETPFQVESQPSKSMTLKISVPLEQEASEAEVVLPVDTAIAKESVDTGPGVPEAIGDVTTDISFVFVEGLPKERGGFASDIVRESTEVVPKVNEAVEMATMSSTEDSGSECADVVSVSSTTSMDSHEMATSVQTKANGFNEATWKTIPEASKPYLPHKSLSWMRFVTFCCGGPAVRRPDNTLERKNKRTVRPDNTLEHTIRGLAKGASFCCGGSEKLPAVHRPDNTLEHARVSCCSCAEKSKRSVRPDNTLEHTIRGLAKGASFCCGGSEKLPAESSQ